jgi:hypothetical protein
VDVEGDEQASAGTSGGMHGDNRHAGGLTALLEVAQEVARIERVPVLGGEDEPAVTPRRRPGEPPPVLDGPALLERPSADVRQRERRFGGGGLGACHMSW